MYFYNKIAYCWGFCLFVCFNLSGQPVPFDWQPYCTYIQSHFWGICSSHNLLSHPWLISFSHTFNLSAANPRAQPSQSIQRPKPFSPPPLIEIAAIFHLDSLSRHLTSLLFLTSAFPSHLEWFFKKKKKNSDYLLLTKLSMDFPFHSDWKPDSLEWPSRCFLIPPLLYLWSNLQLLSPFSLVPQAHPNLKIFTLTVLLNVHTA